MYAQEEIILKKKLALAATLIIAAGFAMPNAASAKGGHGYGYGGFYGHPHGTPPGWYQGRKVGWRGRGCPPGLWKQGRC